MRGQLGGWAARSAARAASRAVCRAAGSSMSDGSAFSASAASDLVFERGEWRETRRDARHYPQHPSCAAPAAVRAVAHLTPLCLSPPTTMSRSGSSQSSRRYARRTISHRATQLTPGLAFRRNSQKSAWTPLPIAQQAPRATTYSSGSPPSWALRARPMPAASSVRRRVISLRNISAKTPAN